jgi:hypothetical protein
VRMRRMERRRGGGGGGGWLACNEWNALRHPQTDVYRDGVPRYSGGKRDDELELRGLQHLKNVTRMLTELDFGCEATARLVSSRSNTELTSRICCRNEPPCGLKCRLSFTTRRATMPMKPTSIPARHVTQRAPLAL